MSGTSTNAADCDTSSVAECNDSRLHIVLFCALLPHVDVKSTVQLVGSDQSVIW